MAAYREIICVDCLWLIIFFYIFVSEGTEGAEGAEGAEVIAYLCREIAI